MLTAYVFGPQWDLLDPSPFCMKLLTAMQLAGLEHEVKTGMQHIRKAPKGKMPFIRDGDTVLGDSNLIMAYLKAHYDVDLDRTLRADQRPVAHAMGRMLDENTYWVLLYFRWLDDANWEQHTRPAFFDALPFLQRKLLPGFLRKQLFKSARGHGMGRHSAEEIARIGIADFQCLVDLLGDQPFMFGDTPTALDANAYAYCAGLIKVPQQSAVRDFVQTTPLVDYVERMARHLATAAA
ncbi:MAG: glutathione S-transferase family protein [Gammaproteobacteria bacterium]